MDARPGPCSVLAELMIKGFCFAFAVWMHGGPFCASNAAIVPLSSACSVAIAGHCPLLAGRL